MQEVYAKISDMIRKTVETLYINYDEIILKESKINGVEVPWHVFCAISERIKYNANLHSSRSAAGSKSKIILNIEGKDKVFNVKLNSYHELVLSI